MIEELLDKWGEYLVKLVKEARKDNKITSKEITENIGHKMNFIHFITWLQDDYKEPTL